MSELANYSIETDHLVWLAFKDGNSLRVPVGQLPEYLTPRDLQRVRRAMKLRRDFFRHNMPPALLVLLVIGVIGLMAVGGQVALALLNREKEIPATVPPTEIVRNTAPPLSEQPLPVPSPAVDTVATVNKPSRASRTRPASSVRSVVVPAATPQALLEDAPLIVPALPQPSPEPILPSPQPSPLPEPTPLPTPPPGDVLGDSTQSEATRPQSPTPQE